MTERYVYLRNTRSPSRSASALEVEAGDAVLEVADLSLADIADLRRDPTIIIAKPDMPISLIEPINAAEVENEALFARIGDTTDWLFPNESSASLVNTDQYTWGVQAVGAHTSSYTGKGATIAVLDSGIDASHECFTGLKVKRKNFTTDVEEDKVGHGTHCCGTIAGQTVTGKPRVGVAPGIDTLLVGKVLGGEAGSGRDSWIAEGIQWAMQEGAQVISMSLGVDFHGYMKALSRIGNLSLETILSLALDNHMLSLRFYEAVARYCSIPKPQQAGTLIIAASGNASNRFAATNPFRVPAGLPAAAEGVISVGALARIADILRDTSIPEPRASTLLAAPFSNYNNTLSAPGFAIISAEPGNKYAPRSGTSMAAPHVAGVAALWIEQQLKTLGRFDAALLSSQLQGNARQKALIVKDATLRLDSLDIGSGLVQAPQ